MDSVNKTLYIPLYAKAFVSKAGIILQDSKAEAIWEKECFALSGKSKSKWLAYYMGMRAAVFDNWLAAKLHDNEDAMVLHIGCGMDSRVERIGTGGHLWYDIDFPEVIAERKVYFLETEDYHMLQADVRQQAWLENLPNNRTAIVVLEGVSMYMQIVELQKLLHALTKHFESVKLLMDCYTTFAARASKYKNPINDVGVTQVVGGDDPHLFEEDTGMEYIREHSMTPQDMIHELGRVEQIIFRTLFGGKLSKRMYRLYEYQKK